MPSTQPTPTLPTGNAQAAALSHRAAQALATFRTHQRKLSKNERSVLHGAKAGDFDLLAPQSSCWRLTLLRALLDEAASMSPG